MAIVAVFFILITAILAGYVCLLTVFHPADNPGLLGKFYRLIYHQVPDLIGKILRKILTESIYNKLVGFKNYVLRTNHPFVQISYLISMIFSFIAFEYFIAYKVIPNKPIGSVGISLLHLLFVASIFSYYKASGISPGKITKENQQQYLQRYQGSYDNILYLQENRCRTCEVLKAPRSKHCSLCDICVPHQDNHSIWIRRCVGQKNRKWYLLLLLMHTLLVIYLAVVGTAILKTMINNRRQFGMKLNYTNRSINNSLIMFSFFFIQNTLFCLFVSLMYVFSVSLLVYDGYQLYLIQSDRTTSERSRRTRLISSLSNKIKEEDRILEESRVTGVNQQPISYGDLKMSKEQFLKQKEIHLQNYNRLISKPAKGGPNLLHKLMNIISQ